MTDLPSETSTSNVTAGPGRLIRQAREQAGLSIEDLGAQIKLARGTLDALERDDFATLSEPVYVRGYYRKLSKVLPVAEAELLSAYEGLVAPKVLPLPPSKLILSGESDLGGSNRRSLKLVVSVVLIGLLLGALAFWGSTRTATAPAEVVPVPETSALPAAPAPESPAALGLTAAETLAEAPVGAEGGSAAANPSPAPGNALVPATLTLAPTLSQLPPPASATGPVPPPVAPAATAALPATPAPARPASGRAEVQLQFNATSWTRIEDATGKSLLSGVIQAGDRQTLNGEAPFSIFLGNAPGVSIQFNGQPVDMGQYTKGNNTARFTLP